MGDDSYGELFVRVQTILGNPERTSNQSSTRKKPRSAALKSPCIPKSHQDTETKVHPTPAFLVMAQAKPFNP